MAQKLLTDLSRRERQIMDVIYSKGSATAAEVRDEIPDPPSYSTVRALLKVLEEKGFLRHKQQGPRYVFTPTVKRDRAKTTALKHVMQTFFDNSAEDVVAALIDISGTELSEEEYRRLNSLIEQARRKGAGK
jgi:predicted transcriptional regulator